MTKIGEACIAAILVTCGVGLAGRGVQLPLPFASMGKLKRTVAQLQIPPSLHGLQVRANPDSWLK